MQPDEDTDDQDEVLQETRREITPQDVFLSHPVSLCHNNTAQ
jgi:hypothetical protein